jgi:hypothetical protein
MRFIIAVSLFVIFELLIQTARCGSARPVPGLLFFQQTLYKSPWTLMHLDQNLKIRMLQNLSVNFDMSYDSGTADYVKKVYYMTASVADKDDPSAFSKHLLTIPFDGSKVVTQRFLTGLRSDFGSVLFCTPMWDSHAKALRFFYSNGSSVNLGTIVDGKYKQDFTNKIVSAGRFNRGCDFDAKASIMYCPLIPFWYGYTGFFAINVLSGEMKIIPIPATGSLGAMRAIAVAWDKVHSRYLVIASATNGTSFNTKYWDPLTGQISTASLAFGQDNQWFDDPTYVYDAFFDGVNTKLWMLNVNPFYKYTKYSVMTVLADLPKPLPNIVWAGSTYYQKRGGLALY